MDQCLCPRPLHFIVNPLVPTDTLMPMFPNFERTFFDAYIVTSKMNPFFHQWDKSICFHTSSILPVMPIGQQVVY